MRSKFLWIIRFVRFYHTQYLVSNNAYILFSFLFKIRSHSMWSLIIPSYHWQSYTSYATYSSQLFNNKWKFAYIKIELLFGFISFSDNSWVHFWWLKQHKITEKSQNLTKSRSRPAAQWLFTIISSSGSIL